MGKNYWSFETFRDGLGTVWKEYQIIAMRHMWNVGDEGAGSGKTWEATNLVLKEKEQSISRASIIFFLNAMVDEGVLKYVERTGKGGHHRIYRPAFSETAFKEYLVKQIISKLIQEFPDATQTVLGKQKVSFFKNLFKLED